MNSLDFVHMEGKKNSTSEFPASNHWSYTMLIGVKKKKFKWHQYQILSTY